MWTCHLQYGRSQLELPEQSRWQTDITKALPLGLPLALLASAMKIWVHLEPRTIRMNTIAPTCMLLMFIYLCILIRLGSAAEHLASRLQPLLEDCSSQILTSHERDPN